MNRFPIRVSATIFVLLCHFTLFSQSSFQFTDHSKKTVIPFKLVNNLIVFEVDVNGVKLNFLLDSGVEENLLIGLDKQQEMVLKEVKEIKLKGLGSDEPIHALKATRNTMTIGKLRADDQVILVILDTDMNFSSMLGLPINGILGYHFFKDNLVEINYQSKRVTIYQSKFIKTEKKFRKYKKVPITIERAKPYAVSTLKIAENSDIVALKLLIDTGNSSALWLFPEHEFVGAPPLKRFQDFLGRGFSGSIYGDRARIESISLANFAFQRPVTAFPNPESLKNVKMVSNRAGSIGGDVLRRFKLVFDYQNGCLYLKPNASFRDPFHFNKSGIELQHSGLRLVKEAIRDKNEKPLTMEIGSEPVDIRYKFDLKPAYTIAHIRKDSPAEIAGLMVGDVLTSIDDRPTARLSMSQVSELLKSDDEKIITVEVERSGVLKTFKFQLKNVLD